MKFFQETTEWPTPAVNHIYLLSEDKTKMYAYVRGDTKQLTQFKNPIGISVRGRKFKVVENTFGYKIPTIESSNPTWTVVGSKGDVYTVELDRGSYKCSCPGFKFRHKCSHIDKVPM